jgi:hypothetical protein
MLFGEQLSDIGIKTLLFGKRFEKMAKVMFWTDGYHPRWGVPKVVLSCL